MLVCGHSSRFENLKFAYMTVSQNRYRPNSHKKVTLSISFVQDEGNNLVWAENPIGEHIANSSYAEFCL